MKLLFTCVLLVIFSCITLADEDTLARDRFKEDNIQCQKEVGTDDYELAKFYLHGMNPADASEAVKCHMKCTMEKEGIFKNGKFDEELFLERKRSYTKLGRKEVGICVLEKGANDCETAFKIAVCFMKYDKSPF